MRPEHPDLPEPRQAIEAARPHRDAFDRLAHWAARCGHTSMALWIGSDASGPQAMGAWGLDAQREELALEISTQTGPAEESVADIGSDARWVRLDLGRGKQAMRHIHWWPLPRHGHAGLLLIDAHPGHHDGATRRAELARGLA